MGGRSLVVRVGHSYRIIREIIEPSIFHLRTKMEVNTSKAWTTDSAGPIDNCAVKRFGSA